MEKYQDEEYVDDLTERVFLIKQQLEAGKLKIAHHLVEGFIESFKRIRLRQDGKVDPSTVDGRIRAMGAAVNHFLEREDIKTNTLFRTCKVLTLIFFLVILASCFI